MPRTARTLLAGSYYHLINRGNNRAALFSNPAAFRSFLNLIMRAQERTPLAMLAGCIMPNHFHLVAASRVTGDFSRWMHWLLTTHGQHFHIEHGTSGRVWQGRYKAFLIQHDEHLLTVMRYVERNALRAGLVKRAEDWPWGSLAWRLGRACGPELANPPVPLPSDWTSYVNAPHTSKELEALRACVNRQNPYGDAAWTDDATRTLSAVPAKRGRGRPRITDAMLEARRRNDSEK
jgi:REP-associated tyrosine transposase